MKGSSGLTTASATACRRSDGLLTGGIHMFPIQTCALVDVDVLTSLRLMFACGIRDISLINSVVSWFSQWPYIVISTGLLSKVSIHKP